MICRNRVPFVVVLVAAAAAACVGVEEIQPFSQSGRVWPPPPEPARLRYVTEFSAPSDLGIKPSFWGRLADVATGRADESMVRPTAVAASADSQVIYVSDPDAQCVHRFDLRRSRYDCLIQESGQPLSSPIGLAVAKDGRIFVADSVLDLVFVAGPQEKSLRPITLSPAPAQPTGLALNEAGELFVTSTGSHSVLRYDATGLLTREYGGRGSGPGQMNYPTYLWLTAQSELLVSDTMNFRIQRFDIDDGLLSEFGEAGDGAGSLARPKGIAMDRHGHIYIVDGGHHAMQIFDRDGRLLLAVGKQGQQVGEFWLPNGIFAAADDLIFVADAYNQRVQVFRYEEGGR
jgi:sugar lactone lactonase YvrE